MNSAKILFIDAYDSFSNNIIALLQDSLDVTVTVIKHDDRRYVQPVAFDDFLSNFDAVIAGPGPGDPRNARDVSLISRLWTMHEDLCIPVLGICLGFQSLVLAFGGEIATLKHPRHGFVTPVTHRSQCLFEGLDQIKAVQYHSLHAKLNSHPMSMNEAYDCLWLPSRDCPDLQPLAWDLSEPASGPILMAVKHRTKPLWGLQYHPESICTDETGRDVIVNWWKQVIQSPRYRQRARRRTKATATPKPACLMSRPEHDGDSGYVTANSSNRSSIDMDRATERDVTSLSADVHYKNNGLTAPPRHRNRTVFWKQLDLEGHCDVISVMEIVRSMGVKEPLLLESGTRDGKPLRPEIGRYSILGCPDRHAKTVRYWTDDQCLEIREGTRVRNRKADVREAMEELRRHQTSNKAVAGPPNIPFWGGLLGYISYEAGQETIDIPPPSAPGHHPDIWFVNVERSIVIDHLENKLYVQSLRADDGIWLDQVVSRIQTWQTPFTSKAESRSEAKHEGVTVAVLSTPKRGEYCKKVRQCQEHIRAGSSYELCLTDQTTFRLHADTTPSPWKMYENLRQANPAPFSAYLHFSTEYDGNDDDLAILSSSPERFLSWSRTGTCQFRPIKGTVQKSPSMSRVRAEEILKSKKEQAENLMIVDLIRHDLHGVIGTGVRVPSLMSVEEYETVYQLVSVVEGDLPDDKCGLDVLAASLPPGSMTGAPKKRSCELLKELEGDRRRGVYAGVLGYLDAGGGGDFSVVIRTMSKWKGEWSVGAGGAVTALSTPNGEWEEMEAKRVAVLSSTGI